MEGRCARGSKVNCSNFSEFAILTQNPGRVYCEAMHTTNLLSGDGERSQAGKTLRAEVEKMIRNQNNHKLALSMASFVPNINVTKIFRQAKATACNLGGGGPCQDWDGGRAQHGAAQGLPRPGGGGQERHGSQGSHLQGLQN